MKLGRIWNRGKRKFRYAYVKEEIRGRVRTAKVLMIFHAGAWVAVQAGKAYLTYKEPMRYGWK